MLKDVERKAHLSPVAELVLSKIGSVNIERLDNGIFKIYCWSPEYLVEQKLNPYYDALIDRHGEGFNPFGVCDSYQQVLDLCPMVVDSEIPFVIFITPIKKCHQPPSGGWRWEKWGPYIGTQDSKREYLYDEPDIDLVYTYHIYQII